MPNSMKSIEVQMRINVSGLAADTARIPTPVSHNIPAHQSELGKYSWTAVVNKTAIAISHAERVDSRC
jgi:hypothetical protein